MCFCGLWEVDNCLKGFDLHVVLDEKDGNQQSESVIHSERENVKNQDNVP